MNERIKLLVEQATIWEGMEDGYIFNKEKFAQLIVRECANIAMREDHDPAECIKKHFGVEEWTNGY